MSAYIDRYIKFFEQRKEKIALENGQIFRLYNKMAIAFGPVMQDFSVSKNEAGNICKKLGSVLIRWTNQMDKQGEESDWYAVICDEFVSLETMKSKLRNQVKKSMASCEVRRISSLEIIEKGFDVYKKATQAYSNVIHVVSENQFKDSFKGHENFEDIIHYWGVYYDEKLIAYAHNYVFDKTEVSYNVIKIDPEFLFFNPSYALIFKMNEFYLKEQGFIYVNDGFKSILHDSNIQGFLMQKFNFRKAYCSFNIEYKKPLDLVIKIAYPFRNILAKADNRFKALFEMESIRRAHI